LRSIYNAYKEVGTANISSDPDPENFVIHILFTVGQSLDPATEIAGIQKTNTTTTMRCPGLANPAISLNVKHIVLPVPGLADPHEINRMVLSKASQ
jgi:hypothetical protein